MTTYATEEKKHFINTTYRLDNVPGRGGILIHWGNESDDSAGCLLVNRNDPSTDIYSSCCKPTPPLANNYYSDSKDFMVELMSEISELESLILSTHKDLKSVPKTIKIYESQEITD